MKTLTLKAYLGGFSSKTDRSAGIRFSTQELTPEEFAQLQDLNGEFGWLVFEPQDSKVPPEPPKEFADEEKSPSKRLRAVLYVLWEQAGSKGTFENYYREQMGKIILHVKGKLD